jgi:hypothetical protein
VSNNNAGTPDATAGGTSVSGVTSRFNSGTVNFDLGTYNNGAGFLQSRNTTNNAVYYDLILNPTGGNVGIGNATPGNTLSISGSFYSSGNVTASNLITSGLLSVTGNANVGNVGATNGVFTGNIGVTANATFGNINSVSGILSVTGNANVGNIGATRAVFTNIAGTIESGSASQTNITALGTLTSLTVSGLLTAQANVAVTSNITAGNINSVSGILTVTGNITGGNLIGTHAAAILPLLAMAI